MSNRKPQLVSFLKKSVQTVSYGSLNIIPWDLEVGNKIHTFHGIINSAGVSFAYLHLDLLSAP